MSNRIDTTFHQLREEGQAAFVAYVCAGDPDIQASLSIVRALADAGVICWGSNAYGELNVPQLANPTHITVGIKYSCAKDDSGLVCWGWDGYGGTRLPVKPATEPDNRSPVIDKKAKWLNSKIK